MDSGIELESKRLAVREYPARFAANLHDGVRAICKPRIAEVIPHGSHLESAINSAKQPGGQEELATIVFRYHRLALELGKIGTDTDLPGNQSASQFLQA